jgi:chromosome segregation ATPase
MLEDLTPLKALIRERDVLHKEQTVQQTRKIALLSSELESIKRKLISYEQREIQFCSARDDFLRDVKDLERASSLLQRREHNVEVMNDDLERQLRKKDSHIRSLQDEIDAKSSQLTSTIEEYGRYRENVGEYIQ